MWNLLNEAMKKSGPRLYRVYILPKLCEDYISQTSVFFFVAQLLFFLLGMSRYPLPAGTSESMIFQHFFSVGYVIVPWKVVDIMQYFSVVVLLYIRTCLVRSVMICLFFVLQKYRLDCLLIIDFALDHCIISYKRKVYGVVLMTHFVHPHCIELLQLVPANVNLLFFGVYSSTR